MSSSNSKMIMSDYNSIVRIIETDYRLESVSSNNHLKSPLSIANLSEDLSGIVSALHALRAPYFFHRSSGSFRARLLMTTLTLLAAMATLAHTGPSRQPA